MAFAFTGKCSSSKVPVDPRLLFRPSISVPSFLKGSNLHDESEYKVRSLYPNTLSLFCDAGLNPLSASDPYNYMRHLTNRRLGAEGSYLTLVSSEATKFRTQ